MINRFLEKPPLFFLTMKERTYIKQTTIIESNMKFVKFLFQSMCITTAQLIMPFFQSKQTSIKNHK